MTHNHHHSGCEVVEGVGMGWRACLEGWLVGWMVEQEGVFGGLVGCLVPTREWIVALWPPACPLCLPPACSQNTKPCIYVCAGKNTKMKWRLQKRMPRKSWQDLAWTEGSVKCESTKGKSAPTTNKALAIDKTINTILILLPRMMAGKSRDWAPLTPAA